MSLLPQTYTHFCTKCGQPFESLVEHITMFGDILCYDCQGGKLGDCDFDKDWYPKTDNSQVVSFRDEVLKEVRELLYKEYDAIELDYNEGQTVLTIKQAKKDLLFNIIKKVQEI